MECSYPRILPVNVDAIEAILVDEVGNVGGHGQTIGGSDALTKDHISARVGGKIPTTDGQDAPRALDPSEDVELVGGRRAGDLNRIGRGEHPKAEIDVRVSRNVELGDVLVEAGTV